MKKRFVVETTFYEKNWYGDTSAYHGTGWTFDSAHVTRAEAVAAIRDKYPTRQEFEDQAELENRIVVIVPLLNKQERAQHDRRRATRQTLPRPEEASILDTSTGQLR